MRMTSLSRYTRGQSLQTPPSMLAANTHGAPVIQPDPNAAHHTGAVFLHLDSNDN